MIINKKQYHIPGRIAEISVTIKNLMMQKTPSISYDIGTHFTANKCMAIDVCLLNIQVLPVFLSILKQLAWKNSEMTVIQL